MPYFTLAIFLLAVGLLWVGVLIFFMARHLLAPRRMTDARAFVRVRRTSPADLGLSFAPMNFTVHDARSNRPIRIAGWWVPAASPSEKTVLIVHGYGDAKVGGIAWTPTWHSLGWNCLAIDLRAHGESDGHHTTAGYFERDDLDQILNALRLEKPAATQTVALFGVSLGAACVAGVAARRKDVAAVVLESPYHDYRAAVRVHVRRSGFPLVGMSGAICKVAEMLSGADFRDVRPEKLIPQIAAPLLVIHGEADFLVQPAAITAAIAKRPAGTIAQHDVYAGVPHVMALAHDPTEYKKRLQAFLNTAINDAMPPEPLPTPAAVRQGPVNRIETPDPVAQRPA